MRARGGARQAAARGVGGAGLSRHSPRMRQPLLLALAAIALLGCQRNHTTTEENARAGKPVTAAAPTEPVAVPGDEAAAPEGRTAPVAAAGSWQLSPLGRDVERICNVLTYTGTVDKKSNEQLSAILEWLPSNIESEDGRNFLGSIGDLQGTAKADALDAGARKVGLGDCQLAMSWRK